MEVDQVKAVADAAAQAAQRAAWALAVVTSFVVPPEHEPELGTWVQTIRQMTQRAASSAEQARTIDMFSNCLCMLVCDLCVMSVLCLAPSLLASADLSLCLSCAWLSEFFTPLSLRKSATTLRTRCQRLRAP